MSEKKLTEKDHRNRGNKKLADAIPAIVKELAEEKQQGNGKKKSNRVETPGFKEVLNKTELERVVDLLTTDQVYEFWSSIGNYFHYWIGDPTEEIIEEIRVSIDSLSIAIDFPEIVKRLDRLGEFERSAYGISLRKFFPELVAVYEHCVHKIKSVPSSVEKSACWLRVVAADAGADANLEAAIYLASRGELEGVDVSGIRDQWYGQICDKIERGQPIRKVPPSVVRRAKEKTISLFEAAKILTFQEWTPRFFSFSNSEEAHIDQTMFRSVEWLGISGYDAWLTSMINGISAGPSGGIDHIHTSWSLFYWCRSNLALQTAERMGLESWLWTLMNGAHEKNKPWRVFWGQGQKSGLRDYLSIAGLLPFIWKRIGPSELNDEIPAAAIALLEQTQLKCGAWPLIADETKPSLTATIAAVHGLAEWKPLGWQNLTTKAADWLLGQQDELGFWDTGGGPTVSVCVQVLDAIELSTGGKNITYSNSEEPVVHGDVEITETKYNFSSMDWHEPSFPTAASKRFAQAKDSVAPKLALLVATETELKQVLRLMRPLQGKRKLWKCNTKHETMYIGRFAEFETVVVLCTMGTQGPLGATLTANAVIEAWKPLAAIFVGIAFGAERPKHREGDVLVATSLIPYENQRIGESIIFRNPSPPCGSGLLSRFRNALGWNFVRPDKSTCKFWVGPLLTGEKLVDDLKFKRKLLTAFPSAIGGEMEGAGLWSAATRHGTEWIVVKAVCDWGDGNKHKQYQGMAAASAASFCLHVFDDPHALDGF